MENKDINHPIWGYHISGNPYMRIYIVYLDIWKPWHKQFHTMCIAGCVYNISYCTRNNVWKTSNPISHDPSSFSPFQWPVWGILSLRQNQILYYCWYIYIYISGWWLTYPSEKYESPSGWLFPYIMENKKCLKPPTSTIMLGTDHDCGRWEPRYIYLSLSLSPVISIPQMILPGDGAMTPDFWRCSSRHPIWRWSNHRPRGTVPSYGGNCWPGGWRMNRSGMTNETVTYPNTTPQHFWGMPDFSKQISNYVYLLGFPRGAFAHSNNSTEWQKMHMELSNVPQWVPQCST